MTTKPRRLLQVASGEWPTTTPKAIAMRADERTSERASERTNKHTTNKFARSLARFCGMRMFAQVSRARQKRRTFQRRATDFADSAQSPCTEMSHRI